MDQKTEETNNISPKVPKGTRGGTLTQKQYSLFVQYLTTKQKPSKTELKMADLHDSPLSMFKHGHSPASRFKSWAKRMALRESDNALLFRKTGKEILYREQFEEIVRRLNESEKGTHLSFSVTLKKIREKYTMGSRQFGMNEDVVREILFTCTKPTCPCKKVKKLLNEDVPPKPVRATKSCSSLPDKISGSPKGTSKSVSQAGSQESSKCKTPKDSNATNTRASLGGSSAKTVTKSALPCYSVFSIADIPIVGVASSPAASTESASNAVFPTGLITFRQPTSLTTHQNTSTPILYSQSSQICLPPAGNIIQYITNPAHRLPGSIQSVPSGSITDNCKPATLSQVRPPTDLAQRSILYRICANQQSLNTAWSQDMSVASPNKLLPCVRRELIGNDFGGDTEIKTTSEDITDKSGPFASVCDLDWESFTSLSVFGETLGGQTGLQGTQSKATQASGSRSLSHKSPASASGIPKVPSTASFFVDNDKLTLSHPEMWYFPQDIVQESNRYKRLVGVIKDMKLDVQQAMMGSKSATERLRKKILCAEVLIHKCKDITIARERLAKHKQQKGKKEKQKTSNHGRKQNIVKTT